MKSGMLAAEAYFSESALQNTELTSYQSLFDQSWIKEELYQVRNIRPGFKYGLWPGLMLAVLKLMYLKVSYLGL